MFDSYFLLFLDHQIFVSTFDFFAVKAEGETRKVNAQKNQVW